MAHQDGNVGGAVAQRRRKNRKHFEAVKEVAAEFLFRDHFGQIAIGGGDEAHVDGDGPRAAQALDLALLQSAQQLRLQVERQLAHLVEEERALVRQLQAADFARDGAGERALLVAEEFAFEQARREWPRNSA